MLMILGIIMLLVSIFLLFVLFGHLSVLNILEIILYGLLLFFMIEISIGLTIMPFSDNKIISSLINALLIQLKWTEKLLDLFGHYSTFIFAPIWTILIVLYFPFVLWSIAYRAGLVSTSSGSEVTYFILVISIVALTFLGERIVKFIVKYFFRRDEDFLRLFSIFNSYLIRPYIYGLMALIYMIANLEKFSGITLIHLAWWTASKGVLVEVLLTYVIFDSLMMAYRDYRMKKRLGSP